MQLQPHTDLTQFTGKRVVINRLRGARIDVLRHSSENRYVSMTDGFGGMCVEDPHGDCRGGATGCWWPYGTDLTIED